MLPSGALKPPNSCRKSIVPMRDCLSIRASGFSPVSGSSDASNSRAAISVETPGEEPGRISPEDHAALQENIAFARSLGAQVIRLRAENKRKIADTLIGFARRQGVTHVVFGQTARSRWDILLHGSIINRFLNEVRAAAVQVVPLEEVENSYTENSGG